MSLQLLLDFVGDGFQLAFAFATGDDKIISDKRDRARVEQKNVRAFLVRNNVDDQARQFARFQSACLRSVEITSMVARIRERVKWLGK